VWILRSYRWRRRLIAIVLVVGVAVPLVYLGVHLSTPGNPGNANGPEVRGYTQPKTAPFTRAKQRAVRGVLAAFIKTAVARQDLGPRLEPLGPKPEGGSHAQGVEPR
jgi:hypothetical protein